MLFRLVFFIEFMFLMLNYFLGYYQNSNLHVIYVWGCNYVSDRLCSSQQILGLIDWSWSNYGNGVEFVLFLYLIWFIYLLWNLTLTKCLRKCLSKKIFSVDIDFVLDLCCWSSSIHFCVLILLYIWRIPFNFSLTVLYLPLHLNFQISSFDPLFDVIAD
jgi:hypothetical protein